MRRWLVRHAQTFFFSLGVLARAPVATLMTAAVIGVALALPGGLYLLLDNVRAATRIWDGRAQLSVYLHPDAGDAPARALAAALRARPGIAKVRVITRAEALAEYRKASGLGQVLSALGGENPLPAVVVVTPASNEDAGGMLSRLARELRKRPEVDAARLDLEWLRRLNAAVDLMRRGAAVVAALLAAGGALIIGNTIRLAIENRREEIEITRLFGATDAFIRRPFLYTGALYGLLGGLLAWALVGGAYGLLLPAVDRLAGLYGGGFAPRMLDLASALALPLGGAGIGLAGAWLAVGRHLRAVAEPS